jgi:hypothetical protein
MTWLAHAAEHASHAKFRCESFVSAKLPKCIAVTAIGEIFNYVADHRNTSQQLKVFHCVHDARAAAGLFLFDFAEPGRVTTAANHAARFEAGCR